MCYLVRLGERDRDEVVSNRVRSTGAMASAVGKDVIELSSLPDPHVKTVRGILQVVNFELTDLEVLSQAVFCSHSVRLVVDVDPATSIVLSSQGRATKASTIASYSAWRRPTSSLVEGAPVLLRPPGMNRLRKGPWGAMEGELTGWLAGWLARGRVGCK